MSPSSLLTRRPQVPAWTISMVVHMLLMLLVLLWVERMPEGASDETLREAGIVLKRTTTSGVKFEGEEEIEANKTADANSPNPEISESLPDIASHSTASEALPTLPGPGLMTGTEGNPSAAAMAEGGGTRGGARGDIGEKATTQVFGVKGTGTKFVYLFDRSSSMQGAPMAAAKRQLLASLESLEEIHQFHIIFFNNRPLHAQLNTGTQQRLAFADSQSKLLAERFVAAVEADGGTERDTALLAALNMAPDVIFFLTDADGGMDMKEINKVLRKNQRAGTSICTIEFGQGPGPRGRNFLVELAERTGGEYGYIDVKTMDARAR